MKLCRLQIATVAALLLVGTPAFAQDSTGVAAVEPDEVLFGRVVAEDLRPSPRVSGARVRGYAVLPASRGGKPEFTIHIPPDWKGGPMCLRVVSADALYEAEIEFEVAASQRGKRLPVGYFSEFESDFWSVRAGMLQGDALAALATPLGCAGSALTDMVTSLAVTSGTGQSAPASLLLNSFGAESGFVQIGDASETIPCLPIMAPVRTGYDMRCDIFPTGDASRPLQVTVWPVKSGELGLPIEVSVWTVP